MDPSAFQQFEQSGWQRAAEFYGSAFGGVTMQTIPRLIEAAGAGPGVRLLDVATGPGYAAEAAFAAGASVVAVDFSPAMIALARRRYPSITFEQGDAEALRFADSAFDAVTMNFGVLHLAQPDTALAEASRVLSVGGRLAFTVWARPEDAIGFGIVLQAIEAHGTLDVPLPPGPPFFRFSDFDECRRTLTAVGFEDIRVAQLPLVWRLASADGVYHAFVHGAVRTAALLRAQSPQASEAIRRTIRDRVEEYRRGAVIELPMAAVLASGIRGASC
jgi:ubiquinone/menaquinone biosynthesis C-methylase UbiE